VRKLFVTSPADLPGIWDEVKPFIDRALKHDYGRRIAEDFIAGITDGSQRLWYTQNETAEIDAIAITEILDYPRLRACSMVILSGVGMENWVHFEHEIRAWALEKGCQKLEGRPRPGMERAMPEWKKTAIFMEIDLCPAANQTTQK